MTIRLLETQENGHTNSQYSLSTLCFTKCLAKSLKGTDRSNGNATIIHITPALPALSGPGLHVLLASYQPQSKCNFSFVSHKFPGMPEII